MPDEASLIDEKWSRYPSTVLEFTASGGPRIDLRKPIQQADRQALAAIGLERAFAVLTAENPWGENADDEPTADAEARAEQRNAERRARLEADLRAARIEFQPCDGVAPDGDYREHGVAVVVPRQEAVMIARRYKQLAIFWFDGRRFLLVGALARKPDEKLPRP